MLAVQQAALAHLHGDADAARLCARQALADVGAGHWLLRSIARWHHAAGEWLAGDVVAAEQSFASWADSWGHEADPTVAVWGDFYLGRGADGPRPPDRSTANL